jgi:ankyrin repeat protein
MLPLRSMLCLIIVMFALMACSGSDPKGSEHSGSVSELGKAVSELDKSPTSTAPIMPKISLFDAIGKEDVVTVKRYMDAGANPNDWFIAPEFPWAGASALHLAVVVGNEVIVQILLDNGSDIDTKALDQPGGTPLQWASFFGIKHMADLLVAQGADVNIKDNNGCSILCAATIPNALVAPSIEFTENRAYVIELLIANGAR